MKVHNFSEFVNESKWRSLSREIVNDLILYIKATYGRYELTDESAHTFTFPTYNLPGFPNFNNELTVQCLIIREKNAELQIDASAGDDHPNLKFLIRLDPRAEPKVYSKLYMKLSDDVRHELEHIDQYENNPTIFTDREIRAAINVDPNRTHEYFLLPEEVPAMVAGMYNRAKKSKDKLINIFTEYLSFFLNEKLISKKQYNQIIKVWLDYAKRKYPNIQ